jgi:hypothetical protein
MQKDSLDMTDADRGRPIRNVVQARGRAHPRHHTRR